VKEAGAQTKGRKALEALLRKVEARAEKGGKTQETEA
jgi:hypothetical protein